MRWKVPKRGRRRWRIEPGARCRFAYYGWTNEQAWEDLVYSRHGHDTRNVLNTGIIKHSPSSSSGHSRLTAHTNKNGKIKLGKTHNILCMFRQVSKTLTQFAMPPPLLSPCLVVPAHVFHNVKHHNLQKRGYELLAKAGQVK